jgi:hypothetical protein
MPFAFQECLDRRTGPCVGEIGTSKCSWGPARVAAEEEEKAGDKESRTYFGSALSYEERPASGESGSRE